MLEIFPDGGHVGYGNAALAPRLTTQAIDLYLAPLLTGAAPFDVPIGRCLHRRRNDANRHLLSGQWCRDDRDVVDDGRRRLR